MQAKQTATQQEIQSTILISFLPWRRVMQMKWKKNKKTKNKTEEAEHR